ncbi:MAG: C4-dicarboxylate ABC transporter permease, partial [Gammaproteobacteria bacterium]
MDIAGILIAVLFLALGLGLWVSLSLLLVAVSGYWLIDNPNWGQITATIAWGSVGLSVWLDKIPGKLFHVNILSCGIFAAVSGSSAATVATVGNITLPQLKRLGYRDAFSIATLGGSGTLGLLIPPSIMMIIYGVAAEISVARLFMAGVFPGLLLIALFMGYTIIYSLLQKSATPEKAEAHGSRLQATLKLLPIVGLIIAVLGSIYIGFATPIEASALGV